MVHPNVTSPFPIAPSSPRRSVMPRYAAVATANLVLVGCMAAILGPPGAVASPMAALAVFAVAAVWAGAAMAVSYPHPTLGLANMVTLGRLALAASLVAILSHPDALGRSEIHGWAATGIAALALCLDGIDGRLARNQRLASEFGARFDMEVDAFFAALLAMILVASGKVGLWALPLGFMRYGFVAAALMLPWLRAPLPERVRRKIVCVLQIGTLVVLLAPAVGPETARAAAAFATAALVWSFGVDIAWLWRRRG